jgi:hypothetical protein
MIVQEGRSITVPIVFSREGVDSHNNKTNVFLETSIKFKLWNEEGYENNILRLLKGRSGRMIKVSKDSPLIPESMLKVYMITRSEDNESAQELDGFLSSKYDGLTMTLSKTERVLSAEEAIAKINSGTVMFLTEKFQKRTFDV